MSKRIVIAGLLAVGLSLAMAGSAQAQHYHNGGHYYGGNYGGGGGHYYGGNYGGGYYAPVYRPVVVVPSYGYNSINSPYFGFGNSSYGNQFATPVYGYNRGYGYNNGYGYNSPGVLNIGYSRPGFGINFGTIIR